MIPLFEQYPGLKGKLAHVSLCQLPTPVKKLVNLGKAIGLDPLYIKQDGLSGLPFGGNKVRKLEFLLGEALRQGADGVITFGYAGSNHALATAIYAKQVGLKSISLLLPQPNAHYVRRNLLLGRYYGAELHQSPTPWLRLMGARRRQWLRRLKREKPLYVIPAGGSSPLGVLGFVNAAFELKRQIENKELPEPDCIYVALGTAGTLVGLSIGIKALGIKSRIIPVRVVDHHFMNKQMMMNLFSQTVDLLHSLDASFPRLDESDAAGEIEIRDEYLGDGYARFTGKGMEAAALMEETEGIRLDGTYTGKAASALIDDAQRQRLKGKVVLFWNTLNAHDLSGVAQAVDYHGLPKSVHRYFKDSVQPLDAGPEK